MLNESLRALLRLSSPTPTSTDAAPVEAADAPPDASPLDDGAPFEVPSASSPPYNWGWLWSSVPALLFLPLVLTVGQWAPPQPVIAPGDEVRAMLPGSPTGTLLASETMIVTPRRASGYSLLRGRLEPTLSIIGRATVGGQVARVWVRSGQTVNAGDRLVTLSTGPSVRRATRSERVQDRAEAAQVEAVRAHSEAVSKLQSRAGAAQGRLNEAKLRVDAAQRRLAKARQLVQKLVRGEDVASLRRPVRRPKRASTPRRTRVVRADTTGRRAALREAEQAQQAAVAAAARAASARDDAASAAAAVPNAKKKVEAAREAADKADSQFEAGKIKGADVAAARAAVSDAQSAVAEAEARADSTRLEVEKLQTAAESARNTARQAAARAERLPAPSAGSDENSDDEANSSAEAPEGSKSMTVTEAAQLVREAVDESEAAYKDFKKAQRVKNQVDYYVGQVHESEQRVDATGKKLQDAQEKLFGGSEIVQPNLSVVRARAAGSVLWVSGIAREVESGEPVVGIGSVDVLEARFADTSGAWKALKPNMLLPAIVEPVAPAKTMSQLRGPQAGRLQTAPKVAARDAVGAENKTPLAQPVALTADLAPGAATMVRLRSIEPPQRPGQPALLRVAIYNPPQPEIGANPAASGPRRRLQRRFQAGMRIFCSVLLPGNRQVLSIPSAAIARDSNGRHRIAVLTPAPSASPSKADLYRVDWRVVTLGNSDGVQQEVKSGLRNGERIALQPATLHAVNLSYDAETLVRLATVS